MSFRVVGRSLGVGLIVAGTLFMVNTFSGITGMVVIDSMPAGESSVWGIACILGGLVINVMSRQSDKGDLERKAGELTKINREIRDHKVGTARELVSHAKKLGYEVEEKGSKYTIRDEEGHKITTFDRRLRSKGTYVTELKALRDNYDASASYEAA